MDHFKLNTNIKPIDPQLIKIFDYINLTYQIDIYDSRVLEVGIGSGNKSIELAKLFRSYYGIEPNKEIYTMLTELCAKYECKIKTYNTSFNEFIDTTDKKFNLILLVNVIHFMNLDDFISKCKNITSTKSDSFILIKNPKARPYGWADKKICKDSEQFDENKWTKFRERLKTIYDEISKSKYFVKKYTNDVYHYFLLKI